VDVTTHAPLRSRWTNAVPVYHVRATGNTDSLPSPSQDTTLEGGGSRPSLRPRPGIAPRVIPRHPRRIGAWDEGQASAAAVFWLFE
jgi:hypothetical protein